ncbi:MAG: hypothetical protein PWR30_235 [Candidatus Woesearchaeota archaeon]|nr:hypothetical protein [Candidatus Woesearchaeota archaeon]
MDSKDKIIEYIRKNGPSQPIKVAKELGVDSIIASALMANLASKKLLNISHMKVGGSPLYYLKGQERDLQKFSEKLPSMEKEAFELIKNRLVIRDDELEPSMRVAMSHIPDFAKPITVMLKDSQEIKFWKWYLLSNDQTSEIIKNRYFKEEREERQDNEKDEDRKQKVLESFGEKAKESTKSTETEEKEGLKNDEEKNERIVFDGVPKDIKEELEKRRLVIEKIAMSKGKDSEIIAHIDGFQRQKIFVYITRKKRINEKDIAIAHLKSELAKALLIIMHKGEFTKDAMKMLNEINAETIKF